MNEIIKHNYTLRFDIQGHEVDASVLAQSLLSFSSAIMGVNSKLTSGKEISIKVKPFKEGSFEVPMELIEVVAGIVLTNSSIVPQVFSILKEVIDVRIGLKGYSPREVTTTSEGNKVVTTQDGSVFNISGHTGDIVFNQTINTNCTINKSLDTLGEIAHSGSPVQFLSNECDSSTVELDIKEPITPLSTEISVDDYENEKTVEVKTNVSVYTPVFDKKGKWKVIFEGNKIPTQICDNSFISRVLSGEKFACGDSLEVLLKIYKKREELSGIFINKKYEILQVFKHVARSEQKELPL